jgi:hypothetical protein
MKVVPKEVTFQNCFGHNRLEAFRQWKNDPEAEIAIEFDNFTDRDMIQKLAEDNKGRASNAYEKRARWDLVNAAFKWLRKYPRECERNGSTAERHEGECTAVCISELLGKKGYPERTVRELLSSPRPMWPEPEEKVEPVQEKEPDIQTSVSAMLDEGSTVPEVRKPGANLTQENPVATTTLSQAVADAVREDDELLKKRAKPSPVNGSVSATSTAGNGSTIESGPTTLDRSMDRLLKLYGAKGMTKVAFLKALESWMERLNT